MKKLLFKIACAFLVSVFSVAALFCSGCADKETPDDKTDAREEIVIGSDEYRPFFFTNGDGKFSGIDVEIATEAFARMGYKAKFIQIEWNKKDVLLSDGEIDCLWGCFSMTGREDVYSWAGPYMNSTQAVLVRKDSDIYSLSDLDGKRVAVQSTSKPDEIFSDMLKAGELKLKNLLCFTSIDNVYASLRKGYADAIAGHMTAIRERIKNYSDDGYRFLSEPLMQVRLGIAFAKGTDGNFILKINETLEEMTADGSVGQILDKYGVDVKYALDGIKGYEQE